MKKEIWKPIPGYEGLYEVSNFGRVRSLRFGKIRIIKSHKDKLGYRHIRLIKDEKRKMYLVHRLVAMAFIPNPDNLPIINHKDENPDNNSSENLEWCTYQYNNAYGHHGEKLSKSITGTINRKGTSKIVLQIDIETGQIIEEYPSTRECGRNGFDQSAVSKCCRGKLKQYKGFIFRYKNAETTI